MDIVQRLSWGDSSPLFPGAHSTIPKDGDEDIPWKCISEIIPGLYLTCEMEVADRTVCIRKGICLLLNLCGTEHESPYTVYEFRSDREPYYRRVEDLNQFIDELNRYSSVSASDNCSARKVFIRAIPAIDSPQYEIDKHFPELCSLIGVVIQNRGVVEHNHASLYDQLPAVGVHCLVGVSRSASVVVAYLMKRTCMTRDQALLFTQCTRSVANPNPGFQQQLLLWQATNCKRIFDEFSALLVASELRKTNCMTSYVGSQLPVILQNAKCCQERRLLGYVIAQSQPTKDDLMSVYREFRSYVTAAIDCEVYTDRPGFFSYISEVVCSFQCYVPELFLCATDTHPNSLAIVWNDTLYYRMIRDIGRSGFVKDTYDTVRAFCALLETINIKHFRQLAEKSPIPLYHRPATYIESPQLALSFPFLLFIASYAEGFVQFSELNSLEEKYSKEGPALTPTESNRLVDEVAELFIGSFFVCASGIRSDEASTDVTNKRWNTNTPLLYLRFDIEVRCFEVCQNSPADCRDRIVSKLRNALQHSDTLTGQILAYKAASGVIAYRLLLEAVEQFVTQVYAKRVHRADLCLCERRLPLSAVEELLSFIEGAYERAYSSSAVDCRLSLLLKSDIELLHNCGVINEDGGVWSSLQKRV